MKSEQSDHSSESAVTPEDHKNLYEEENFSGQSDLKPFDKVEGEQLPPFEIGEHSGLEEGARMNFSGKIAEEFEKNVIPRQIPGYDQMRYRLLHTTLYFLREKSAMLDIGTSNGRMIRDTIAALANRQDSRLVSCKFLGMDYEQDMVNQANILMDELREDPTIKAEVDRHRVKTIATLGDMELPYIDVKQGDLTRGLGHAETDGFSVITSVLVIQFIPIEHRPRIIKRIYDALQKGGAFIFVEKILSPNVELDDMFQSLYYDDKARNGISHEDILKKRISLERVLMPYTDQGNIELLEGAGFKRRNIETFWQDLNFKAYIAVKS